MSYTYKITVLGAAADNSICPPSIVYAVFPNFSGQTVTVDTKGCTVTFDSPQTPVDLGPLVKVVLQVS
jgi:hypothetical protein